MLENIKNIIFDLGGVILNIDYNLAAKAFEDLGIENFDVQYSKLKQSTLFDDLETGKIGEDDFVEAIQSLSNKKIKRKEILDAWNAMLLNFPIRRLQILQQLQLYYNTYLCSNTNEIHEAAFNKELKKTCGFDSLASFFDQMYLSHRVGKRKPNEDIFLQILKENKLKPEETVFIDDSIQHIETAKKLGIQTIHVCNGMTMENDIFKQKTIL